MIRYDRLWRWSWSVVAALGVGLAVIEWSVVPAVTCLVLVALASRLAKSLVPGDSPVARWSRLLPSSLTVAVAAVTLGALTIISAALALLVALAAVLTSPVVVQHLGRSFRRSRPVKTSIEPPADEEIEDEVSLTPPEEQGPLAGLDDRQLCRLWRESFWALGSPASPQTLLCVVALREACLDELERRHAAALSAWLADGARASSGPEKYLRPGHGGADAA